METLKTCLASHGKSSSPIKVSAGCSKGLSNRTMMFVVVVKGQERLVATMCNLKMLSKPLEGKQAMQPHTLLFRNDYIIVPYH